LIGQYHAINAINLGLNLKWVILDFGGHRTTNHQPRFAVVAGRADDQCWAMSRLLVSRLGIKLKPDNVTSVRDERTRRH
jgi:hypothetical protein